MKHTKKQKRNPKLAPSDQKAVNKQIKKYLSKNMELKYHVVAHYLSPSTTYDISHITGISAGTTDLTRIGDEAKLTRVELNYMIIPADSTNMLRLVIVQWKELSTPTWGNIFNSDSTSNNAYLLSSYHSDNKRAGRFTVLYDKLLKVPVTTVAGSDYTTLTEKVNLKMKYVRRKLTYDAGGTNCYDGLYFMAVSDSSAPSHPTVYFYSTVYFTDA